MAEPQFSNVIDPHSADDDLPRALRREREAQARRARETENAAAGPKLSLENVAANDAAIAHPAPIPLSDFDLTGGDGVTVARLEIPFLHLVAFFLKAVIAAIPALIVLLAILWLFGEILTATFPELVKMQVLIRMPPP